jgi:ADP-ribose diphosphatase
MKKKPQVTNTRVVAETRLFQVEQVGLRFSNGVEVQYERLRGAPRGAVLVVPVLDDDTLLLIREYAVGTERYELAFPKGRIDGDESPVAAADRELKEETGYGARTLEALRRVSVAPGYLGHTTHLILARDLYPERLEGDEPEPIEVVPWPLDRFDELLAQPDLTEARSLLALYMVRDRLMGER